MYMFNTHFDERYSSNIGGIITDNIEVWESKSLEEPDFKFVVIEKFLSIENEFSLREGMLLKSYFLLKDMGLSDEKAFGLDKCDVVVEHVPLVYHPASGIELIRVKREEVLQQ